MSSSEIVRASVTDGPWGSLLGALAARSFSGEVAIEAAGKLYSLELSRGMVIAASSPLASDSVLRVALTSHLVTPVHIATITRALAAAALRDQVEVVAEVAHLSAEQTRTLRTRAVTQRAARTFALDEGDVTISPQPPRALGTYELAIEVGAVIFLGARMNLSEVRLANDLRRFGTRFVLTEGADTLLPGFGFGTEGVVIAKLLRGAGATPAEVEAANRDIDPRVTAATIYALVSCGAALATPRSTTETPAIVARTATPVSAPRTMTPVSAPRTRSHVFEPTPTRTVTAPAPVSPRTRNDVLVPRTMTPRPGMRADVPVARAPTVPPRSDAPPVGSRAPTELAPPPEDLAVPRTVTTRPAVARTVTPLPGVARTLTPSPAPVTVTTSPAPLTVTTPPAPRTVTTSPAVAQRPTPDGMTLRTPVGTSGPPLPR